MWINALLGYLIVGLVLSMLFAVKLKEDTRPISVLAYILVVFLWLPALLWYKGAKIKEEIS